MPSVRNTDRLLDIAETFMAATIAAGKKPNAATSFNRAEQLIAEYEKRQRAAQKSTKRKKKKTREATYY